MAIKKVVNWFWAISSKLMYGIKQNDTKTKTCSRPDSTSKLFTNKFPYEVKHILFSSSNFFYIRNITKNQAVYQAIKTTNSKSIRMQPISDLALDEQKQKVNHSKRKKTCYPNCTASQIHRTGQLYDFYGSQLLTQTVVLIPHQAILRLRTKERRRHKML